MVKSTGKNLTEDNAVAYYILKLAYRDSGIQAFVAVIPCILVNFASKIQLIHETIIQIFHGI